MLFGYFTLLVALIIETVGAYYSITGLAAIFSGAVVPILIMGASLEVGKVTAAVWLKMYWERASVAYKLYLVPAVAFLMLLTSMGIFGYLSKAHSDQSLVSGDAVAKVAIYDEKIKTERENIDANRKALKQLDEAVDQVMGRSTDEKGADKAVAIRRGQQKERGRLLAEITESQKRITALNEERAPLAAEFRKVESEVGPIKYIAALVYGDNPDANVLERAVRWVIILIVAVFDPLALVLILAAQQSIRWAQEDRKNQKYNDDSEPNNNIELVPDDKQDQANVEQQTVDKFAYLKKPFVHFKNLIPMPARSETTIMEDVAGTIDKNAPQPEPETDIQDRPGDYLTEVDKEAMRAWKAQNPDDTVKHQRQLLADGKIKKLPWENLQADNDPTPQREPNFGFGSRWPKDPIKGDTFVRVDVLPNAAYKFNGQSWIDLDKNQFDSYAYDEAYIDHLINKIDAGEYDPELLTDLERDQIALRLQNKST